MSIYKKNLSLNDDRGISKNNILRMFFFLGIFFILTGGGVGFCFLNDYIIVQFSILLFIVGICLIILSFNFQENKILCFLSGLFFSIVGVLFNYICDISLVFFIINIICIVIIGILMEFFFIFKMYKLQGIKSYITLLLFVTGAVISLLSFINPFFITFALISIGAMIIILSLRYKNSFQSNRPPKL